MTTTQLIHSDATHQPKPRAQRAAKLQTVRAAIVGAGGYAGAELVGLLLGHRRVRIAGLFASGKNAAEGVPQRFADLFPRWRGRIDMPVQATDISSLESCEADVVFLATPHEVSHKLAPALLRRSAPPVVIDLSAAFRLKDAALYERHYGFEHKQPEWLARAVYGLPETNRASLCEAALIAAPGCYPTSAILPLWPLIKARAVDPGWRIIIDSTSGVSGAGRSPALKSMFCEVSLQPYNVFAHRHAPEIEANAGAPVIFTPHLGAFDRGILSTIHVRLAEGWTAQCVSDALHEAYAREPFVRLLPSGHWPSVAAVERTNVCDIGWAVDQESRHLILVSAIDNLIKGAAGQAVQCMNARFGWPETTGLEREAA